MRSRVKDKVLRSKKSGNVGLRIKKLRAKFSIFMIFIILITSIFVGTLPIKVKAANSSMYVKPVLKDAQGNEYVVDWTNATNDNIMAVAMYDKNKDTSDNLVPVKVVRKDNPNLKYWAYIDISSFDFPESMSILGQERKLNGFLLADRGLVVYGLPTDVDNNDYREDRYRYLGFDITGQPYSNIDFPNDVSSGLHPKDKHWIYRPWEDERVRNSRNGIKKPSIYYKYEKDQAKQWLSTMVWQDPSTGEVTRAVDDGYTPDELLETFHIQSPPSKYTNGTARGWHDTYGSVYYQTFIMPSTYRFDILTIIPIEEADFTIEHEGTDYTDGNIIKQLPEGSNAGQEYLVRFKVQGISDLGNVDRIEWVKFTDSNVSNYSTNYQIETTWTSSTSYKDISLKGSESGETYAIGMKAYYKNGTYYPLGDGQELEKNYVLHKVTITEQLQNSGSASGEITFTPVSSTNISGNRAGWVNGNISVDVKIVGDTEKTVNGSTSWGYTYKDWYRDWYCVERDEDGNCIDYDYTWEYEWKSGSASRNYSEVWKITKFKVWGTGKTLSGTTVNLPVQEFNGTSGTYVITQELKEIKLEAEVTEWSSKSVSWNSGAAPNSGSWNSGDPPKGQTTKPTEIYKSNSGLYYLDKTKPNIVSISPTSKNWTNKTVIVPIKVEDNLSGFWGMSSYIKIKDKSYYNRSEQIINFNHGSTEDTKNAVMSVDGIYEIEVQAEDIAKNQMSKATYGEYLIDKTKPYSAKFSKDNRSYIDENLSITVTVGDNLSGIEEVKYVVNNSPTSTFAMKRVSASTRERREDYDTFTVNITQPGSWWIHVYQRDRAGNETWTTSPEYKIIRLGDSNNRGGNPNGGIWVEPLQMNDKVPRATRFDIIMKTYGLTESEANNTFVYINMPKWVDDDIERKVAGNYSVSSGRTTYYMKYYLGKEEGSQNIGDETTVVKWWKAFIPPYGTPVTLDRNGNRLRNRYEAEIYLEFSGYKPSRTHPSKVYFDVIPETKIKTEIIKNEF